METYTLTIWLLWPKFAGQQASEIIRHIVDSIESCHAIANYYIATVHADGVDSIAVSCVQTWGV